MKMSSLSRCRRIGATALLTLAAVAMAGCAAQSTPTNRYTLPEADSQPPTTGPQARKLTVVPVEVASYLDQEGIVMQTSDIELNAANQNLWAEALGQQLTRRLRQSLAADLPAVMVLNAAHGEPGAQRLTLSVDQFQGRYDGQAVASGEWQLHDGNRLLAQRHFDVSRPLSDDGYPALVRTLGGVWEEVASEIADEIRHVSAPSRASD
ncbi:MULTISPECIES: ABC-type transport auxiliary lipoprotein family protein [Salinicola]|uniref:ABC-type transport auxiliary lipoprotein component domain-containing protein n=1 Tax=Salinicola socius TaxID=404433 RepID=A0A1Q8SPP7_9GAMM|nr:MULTISPECIES: ABC-type transport auxiliary lipoprotein family protein [Salinicola]OLO03366.1 hypothetical protein BTW07_14895 [Salinicola socius]